MSVKRPAGVSVDTRPPKRALTSSPEEGELDDATPPPPSGQSSVPSPPRDKAPAKKVPFPFKKKAPPPDTLPDRPPLPLRDESRHRDDDARRNFPPRPPPMRSGDHWVPGYGDSRASSRPAWDSYPPRFDDDRYYRSRPDADHWQPREYPSQGLVSPRTGRRSRSLSSPRSRSPLSPDSIGREKHRLPRPSYVEEDGHIPYEDDRHRSRGRSNDRRGDTYRDRSPVWGDSYRPNEEDGHYRSRQDWKPRRGGDYDHNYQPISPRTPPRLASPRSPRDSVVVGRADEKQDVLPSGHATVKIALPSKRPLTPKLESSISLLNGREHAKHEREAHRPQSNGESSGLHQPLSSLQRRKPIHRTREEEQDVYGKIFKGCGLQSDYDLLKKLGEGTFGEVHKAVHRTKGHTVALKRILMHNEKEGMPITALREIKILKALRHPNIIDILDMFVVRSRGKESPLSVYMVFPYMDHDLAGLLENERVKLSPSQIKLYMKQLLEGTEYMHRNHILHRDMKAANLLISNTGSLKIADFGLARAYDPNLVRDMANVPPEQQRKYTNCVVTRWYRPPELLMGARQYGGEVDIWGIGCVLGEMFWRKPVLPGSSDLDQLDKIWQLCGTPTQLTWPNHDTLPGCEGVKRFAMHPRRVKLMFESIGTETLDLLDKLLTCNPRERITASQALDHDYFWTDPLPADPKTLPIYEASHEFDKRGRRHPPVGPPIHPPIEAPHRPPAPTRPPLHYSGRPPPPRESFRNGPPYHYGGGLRHRPLPRHLPPPPPSLPPVPVTLPPITYRPGGDPPMIFQGSNIDRPAHLPPRPQDTMRGRGDRGGVPYGRNDPAAELNYD
ncbi:hypothetical protein PHLGIDRAFT_33171 [Phlebiopsis gigantea 11061_1 CR5-6]|uniref:Protein kinase domain-containing protein n=1 Tax=Phlebiopsis gigantea (strain 11061_1 CR5-6) TaxID=745531 RepID=A0A0C3PVJ4_PHLG1|nr:hypothetical protein PHLGIDRAFT_33171 [Phlebiopsis gigantea 11061_1 CR5-6]